MGSPDHLVADAALVSQRMAEWLRGDVVRVFAVAWPPPGRYKVRGLDKDGDSKADRRLMGAVLLTAAAINAVVPGEGEGDSNSGGGSRGPVVVRGEDPGCAAVGFRRAIGGYHTDFGGHRFLVITSHRVAVLRLRDAQDDSAAAEGEWERVRAEDSTVKRLRGVGRFLKKGMEEVVQSVRRPPLSERPDDVVLDCPFELPLPALRGVQPDSTGDMQMFFADGSWALFGTDPVGLAALAGPA